MLEHLQQLLIGLSLMFKHLLSMLEHFPQLLIGLSLMLKHLLSMLEHFPQLLIDLSLMLEHLQQLLIGLSLMLEHLQHRGSQLDAIQNYIVACREQCCAPTNAKRLPDRRCTPPLKSVISYQLSVISQYGGFN